MNDFDDPVIQNARRDHHRESSNNAIIFASGTKTERSDNASDAIISRWTSFGLCVILVHNIMYYDYTRYGIAKCEYQLVKRYSFFKKSFFLYRLSMDEKPAQKRKPYIQ